MKIGLQIPNFTFPAAPKELGSKLLEIAHTADDCGFASLWVMDHFFQIGGRDRSGLFGPAEDEMLEGHSTRSYLAGIGIQHAIFNMYDVHQITPVEIFDREIIPAVAEL